MIPVDAFGYLAGTFLLLMASMKSVTWMRIFNVAGNVTFVLYGVLADILPIAIMNAAMLGLHLYRLWRPAARDRTTAVSSSS